jgi:iron complex outermembrane recepter protein
VKRQYGVADYARLPEIGIKKGTMMSDSKLFRRILMSSTMVAGLAFAAPAFAQEVDVQTPPPTEPSVQPGEAIQDEQVLEEALEPGRQTGATGGEIVVTGTRIARPNLEQSSPVTVVGEEEISLLQPNSAEEFLRQLPGVTPSIGPAVNNGANGSATLNLRGLGSNRNIVLLNERRLVPATLGGIVDLNIIPVALIERVDVFTGGASSVYGADAIAGVTNFITKRDFAGVDLSAHYGITERGDGASYRVDATFGANFDDGRGNAVFSVGHTKTTPVLQGERPLGEVSLSSTSGLPSGSPAAAPGSLLFPLDPSNPLNACMDPASGSFVEGPGPAGTGWCNYNFNPLNVYQTPLDRWTLFGQARYEILPSVELFAEGFFVQSRVQQRIAPSATFFNPFQLNLDNEFLPAGAALQLCEGSIAAGTLPAGTVCADAIAAGAEIPIIYGRRFVEAGPRLTTFTTDTWQAVAGARGPLTSNLEWEISGQYGKSRRVNESRNQGLQERFQQSILGCPPGSASGCVPVNIFGPPGSLQSDAFDFFNVSTFTFVNTELAAASGVISGDLGFASPFATTPIGVAVGVEYRRYEGGQRGDLPSSTPGAILGAGGAFTTIEGEYDSTEGFAELNIPIVEDRPFFHNLTLEAGARYANYSTTGGDWTYKIGGSWSPIRDIKFRGMYSRAVRAPNLGELFAPQNTVLNNRAVDPCQGTVAQIQARGPNHVALCQEQLARVGAGGTLGTIGAPFAGQINVTVGGNPDLDPEIATTFTLGGVLQPAMVPGLTATLDYWNIDLEGAVTSPSQSDVIDGCFSQADPNFTFCQLIFRNPLTGGLSGSPATTRGPLLLLSNLGRLKTDGWDFTAAYRRNLGFAVLNASLNLVRTNSFTFQAIPTTFARQCVGFYSVSCDPPAPKWTWNARTTLSLPQGTDISLLWRHLSSTRVERIASASGSCRYFCTRASAAAP